jgi:putative transposase
LGNAPSARTNTLVFGMRLRYVARPSLRELFKGEKGKERTDEDRTIYDAYVRYGYTMKEIAEHLGFHYATISRAIKRVEVG